MTVLWWIGDVLWAAVVIPVVLVLLVRLVRRALEIDRHVRAIAERSDLVLEHVEALREFGFTADLAEDAGTGLRRYRAAVSALGGRPEA